MAHPGTRITLATRAPTREELRAAVKKTPLGEFFAWWDDIEPKEVEELAGVINSATSERPVQAFLQKHPALLIRHLGGGHGRWVIPQKRLGAEHVTDFVIGDAHSFGHEWFAVELESPTARMFNNSDDPSATLQHAIRQIQDWRNWLSHNRDYASRPQAESGLGLTDIRPNLGGYVIIGRRSDSRDRTKDLRRQMMDENNIEIHTYDWLIDAAGGRRDWFGTPFGRARRHRLASE